MARTTPEGRRGARNQSTACSRSEAGCGLRTECSSAISSWVEGAAEGSARGVAGGWRAGVQK